MLSTRNLTGSSIILQLLIDAANKNEFGLSGGNKTNLSNPSALKRSIVAGYPTLGSGKKGGDNLKRGGSNTKKSIKTAKGSDYLTSDTKKAFNHLWHTFT